VLHVHAGTGTFEDEAIHPVCQSNDWTVFRIDPCQCQTAQGVRPAPRRRHFAKVKQAIEMKEGADLAPFARSGPIDRFLDKILARHSASRCAATMIDGFLSRNAPAPWNYGAGLYVVFLSSRSIRS
jgi:hypothetical protein